jgi:hypothetical protein
MATAIGAKSTGPGPGLLKGIRTLMMAAGLAAWLPATSTAADNGPPSGTRRAMLICGLPGDDERREVYGGAVEKIARALADRCGVPKSEVFVRFGDEPRDGDGPAVKGSRGLSTREGIEADAAEVRRRSRPGDALWVIVLGHGHYDGRHSHLNLPGPDPDERQFAEIFRGIGAGEQVFWITTSASGFFLKPLSAPGRVVVTATEPDLEVNETLFPLALADVLASPPADADRDGDGSLSVLELYLATAADVNRRYEADENLPSEHARLDDNGDGRGSELQEDDPTPAAGGTDPAAAVKRPARRPGPRDDGARAAAIRVDRPLGAGTEGGAAPEDSRRPR